MLAVTVCLALYKLYNKPDHSPTPVCVLCLLGGQPGAHGSPSSAGPVLPAGSPVADSDPTPPLSCLRGAALTRQTTRFAAPAPDRQSTPTYKSLVRAQLGARTFQKILVVKYCCSVITPVFIFPRAVRHLMEFQVIRGFCRVFL